MEHVAHGSGQTVASAYRYAWQLARGLLQLSRSEGIRDHVRALLTGTLGAIDHQRYAYADRELPRAYSERRGAGIAEGDGMHGPIPIQAFATDDRHPSLDTAERAFGFAEELSPAEPPAGSSRGPVDLQNAAVIAEDITAFQGAERALSDGDLRSYLQLGSALVMLRMIGTDKRCTHLSKSWLEFVGRSMVEELGTGWTNGVHPEDRHGCYYGFLATFAARDDFEMEYRLRRFDGAYRWMLDRGVPHYLPDGRFAGYIHTCIDITEQKRALRAFCDKTRDSESDVREGVRQRTTADEQLQQEGQQRQWPVERALESEERYKLALQGANDGMWDWYVGSKDVYYSPRWKSILGYDDHEISAAFDEWRERVHPDDIQQALADVEATVDGVRGEYKNIHRMRHKDGTYRWILARGQLLRDQQGRPYRMIGTHVDITECKERERQLHALPAQLLAAQENERKRIASELHDGVGQSLNVAKLSVEKCLGMLERAAIDTSQHHLQTAVEQIQGAMNEIRTISMDLMPSMLDDLGLVVTVKWFCRVYQETYPQIRVVPRVGVEETEIPAALKLALYRIIQEAFNNVAKHADATKICLELYASASGLILRVSDNGRGLTGDERFNRDALATGLGLRSMRERAESNGGRFAIGPNAEQGTTVCASWSQQQLRLADD